MNTKGTSTDRWTIAAPGALRWEHWGEESILFDRRSGQTHLLTLVASGCLLLLQDADLDLDQLVDKLDIRFQSASDLSMREQITQLLLTFGELGLIKTAST